MSTAENRHHNPRPELELSNPFSTRNVTPGALDFIFPQGYDPRALVARLRASGWRGQIVGPHGSGKSALVGSLIPEIERSGMAVQCFSLHNGQRTLPRRCRIKHSQGQPLLVLIDGYEQLGWIARFRLKRSCRRRGVGLLVTSHASVGFPELWRTEPSLELAQAIVSRFLSQSDPRVDRADVAEAYAACGGDLREVFFRLYDVYEARRRA